MSRAHDQDADGVEVPLELRGAFENPAELARLRRNAFESVGRPYAGGILYGMGLAQGLLDGLRASRRFGAALGGAPRHAGPGLPLLFPVARIRADHGFSGVLASSIEASLHLRDFGPDTRPVCHVSAGYCSGWYSALLGEFLLVRELACAGHDAEVCEFEARPAQAWIDARDAYATHLLAYLDFDAMREAALAKLADDADEAEGSMMGAFDPLSPAVHVWGPVMILPYSGAADSLEAVQTIVGDLGPAALRVVVLDLTGARIDALERTGLLRLLEVLEAHKLESILVGLPSADVRDLLPARAALSLPLRAADISEGISLAFQLARFV
ncbi:MAG: 4-vinyl reductase [Myxococcota bacterium]